MRPKFLAAIVASIILLAMAGFILRREKVKPKTSVEKVSPQMASNEAAGIFPPKTIPIQPNIPSTTNFSVATNSILERIATLEILGARDDSESLQQILVELKNANREVRRAALAATIQFGSRDAIPSLKEIAAQTEDAREKVEILDAIEFLELPPLSEIKKHRRANPTKP